MKLAWYIKNRKYKDDERLKALLHELASDACELYELSRSSDLLPGTEALLSLGGDGTFLSAAQIAYPSDLPVVGVNLGRLGFLSENNPRELRQALKSGTYSIEERDLLYVKTLNNEIPGLWPYALNEVTIMRRGASMLGVDLSIDSYELPTYWADGVLIATSTGSTAYSLSVGGPICTPESKVLIVAPVSPHNLNLRPLIVPISSNIKISLRSREASAVFTMDNRNYTVDATTCFELCAASRPLKRIKIVNSNFFTALRSRLLWGEDLRNNIDR